MEQPKPIHTDSVPALAMYKLLRNQLESEFPPGEADAMMRILFREVAGIEPHQLFASTIDTVPGEVAERIKGYAEQLRCHTPIQYLLGQTEFYGLKFRVTPDVLIPRPETEEIVAWALEQNAPQGGAILDVGTGSGCIAVSIAKYLKGSEVFALDISPGALDVASSNARLNGVDVHFFSADALSVMPEAMPGAPYSMVVSNPPYVMPEEKAAMDSNVLNHEPHAALFTPQHDPLIFYRAIANFSNHLLADGAIVLCEINQALGSETAILFKDAGFSDVEVRKDLFGKDRMLKAVWQG